MKYQFTCKCLISKNTPRLRSELRKLGYTIKKKYPGECLVCNQNEPGEVIQVPLYFKDHDIVDCGVNEELFLALAGMRTPGTHYPQWYVKNENDTISGIIMMDPKGTFYQLNPLMIKEHEIMARRCHLASVEEIINEFKQFNLSVPITADKKTILSMIEVSDDRQMVEKWDKFSFYHEYEKYVIDTSGYENRSQWLLACVMYICNWIHDMKERTDEIPLMSSKKIARILNRDEKMVKKLLPLIKNVSLKQAMNPDTGKLQGSGYVITF